MRIAAYLFGILIALLTSIGCKSKKEVVVMEEMSAAAQQIDSIQQTDFIFAIYERTPCFGMCPSFSLTIYQSGYAEYQGKNFVNLVGYYHTTLNKADLQNIENAAKSINYFSLNTEYDNPRIADLPTVTTGVWNGDSLKIVKARYHAPKSLETLYQTLDQVVANADWKALGIGNNK